MEDNSRLQSSGISFAGLLGIVFIILKLTGHVTWSWLWVLSPLWLPLVVFLCVSMVIVVTAYIYFKLEKWVGSDNE